MIIADISDISADIVLCSAYKNKMTAYQKYTWFLPDWVAKSWTYRKSQPNFTVHSQCSTENIDQALTGHFALSQQFFAAEDLTVLGRPVKEIMKRLANISNATNSSRLLDAPSYHGFVYDSVLLYAHAIKKSTQTDHTFRFNEQYVINIENTTFDGLSGRFRIDKSSHSRITNKTVLQWNGGFNTVLVFNDNQLTAKPINWTLGKIPSDGRPSRFLQVFIYSMSSILVIYVVAVLTVIYTRSEDVKMLREVNALRLKLNTIHLGVTVCIKNTCVFYNCPRHTNSIEVELCFRID